MIRKQWVAAVFAGLSMSVASATEPAVTADEPAAVVTLGALEGDVVRGQCNDENCQKCQNSGQVIYANECEDGDCGRTHHISGWLKGQSELAKQRNQRRASAFAGYMRGKFGYFCPTGNCGRGVPLYGKYGMVYAQNPNHTDPRDGYSFAAPGYGTPVNVPIAPNVRHTYNYGWGIPSSRLTPLRQATVVGPPVDVVHGPRW